jgi:hypothetical protein
MSYNIYISFGFDNYRNCSRLLVLNAHKSCYKHFIWIFEHYYRKAQACN